MSVLSDALRRLLANDHPLTGSAFTPIQRKQLELFARDTRLLEIRKLGAAIIFRLVDRHSVHNYILKQHPLEAGAVDLLPGRSQNIGTNCDSKKGRSGHGCYYLLMKAFDADVLWQDGENLMQPAELTERLGVAALRVIADQSWQCNRPLLLVENQALFDRCDWLPEGFNGCLVYYGGQLSEVLLNWFSEQKRTATLTLFPDYDGVGLANYARLAESLHSDTVLQFYWMANWQIKLVTYGSRVVWSKTRVQFESAMHKLEALNALDDNFIHLGELAPSFGKALEQEAIWLYIWLPT
jgi:hypothetical protein